MKVVQTDSPRKEHLPIKYTRNIKYNFDSLELNYGVGLLRKNPLQKKRVFNKESNGYLKF
jgi:hypothetical protein